jgi:Flp pilus assembly protein TadD
MRAVLLCWALCALPGAAFAVDTPSNMPQAPDALASARAAVAAGDWARALRELHAAVQLDPTNADAHNLLGYSHRKRPEPDMARAFFHYHEALRLNPAHRAAREYLGEAYVQAGQLDKAREQLDALERLCGQTCDEYRDLAAAIGGARPAPKRW